MDPVSSRADPLGRGRRSRAAITHVSNGVSLLRIPITLLGSLIAGLCGIENFDELVVTAVGGHIPLAGVGVASISQPVPLISLSVPTPARVIRRGQSATASGEAP